MEKIEQKAEGRIPTLVHALELGIKLIYKKKKKVVRRSDNTAVPVDAMAMMLEDGDRCSIPNANSWNAQKRITPLE